MSQVEDLYPLSPTQEGMLFHSLALPAHALYVEMTSLRWLGAFDLGQFREAWRRAVARHAVLRTAIVYEGLRSPHQVVMDSAEMPISYLDLTGFDAAEAARAAAEQVRASRSQEFNLAQPPLMRLLVAALPDCHLIVLLYHHMILDGWSTSLLMSEITGELLGEERAMAAPLAFGDYIAWLRGRDQAADLSFWRGYLSGYQEPAAMTLPGVRAGAPPSGTFRQVEGIVPAATVAGLRHLAACAPTTLSSIIEAAWAGTVSRYSGRDDVVIGVTVAGRPAELAGIGAAIGMFINTVPVRVRVERGQQALPWLAAHAALRHQVLDHQCTALTAIQGQAETAPGIPLFDTVVVFESYPGATQAGTDGAAAQVGEVRYETRTNYAVTLIVHTGTGLRLQAIFDAAWFPAGEAEALVAHLAAALHRLAHSPGLPVGEVLAVPDQVRTRLTDDWNGGLTDHTRPRHLLPDLLTGALSTCPDHMAVTDGKARYTYRQLDQRADALARHLTGAGVVPGDRVGICLGRSADLVTAILAVARSGATFVPLDPAHPAARLQHVLADAEPKAVVTDDTAVAALIGWAGVAVDVGALDVSAPPGGQHAGLATGSLPGAEADGVAYLMYTSGSTGRPKGVAVGHYALANLIDSLALRHPGLSPDDRFLSLTTLTFDTALAELLPPLAVGATVYVGEDTLGLDGAELDHYVVTHGITALQATPSRYRLLLHSGWQGAGRPRLYSCGEAFPPDLAAPLAARGSAVWNMYGPTETTVYSSFEQIHSDTARITIGRPISSTQLYVLDQHGSPAPVGCVGELYIGGAGVAAGYWRLPGLTAARFVADPSSGAGMMFRTGDHARYLADGRVELLGRMDRQVKIHGYRIEPAEVEAALLLLPGVAAAAVVERGGRLIAYTVAADPSSAPSVQHLHEGLRRLLPFPMIPQVFIPLTQLPLTPAGKADLLALPDPPDQGEAAVHPVRAERAMTAREAQVAALFCEYLKVDRAALDDDFFLLGGDSLQAMRLTARLRGAVSQQIPVTVLFRYSTPRTLAAHLDAVDLA